MGSPVRKASGCAGKIAGRPIIGCEVGKGVAPFTSGVQATVFLRPEAIDVQKNASPLHLAVHVLMLQPMSLSLTWISGTGQPISPEDIAIRWLSETQPVKTNALKIARRVRIPNPWFYS